MVESNKLISCCKCSLEYVSVACNRTPLCVDWGRNGWVAYGACYSIALYRPQVGFKAVHADPDLHVQMRICARIFNLPIIADIFVAKFAIARANVPRNTAELGFCPRVLVHKNRYKRPNNIQWLNKGS